MIPKDLSLLISINDDIATIKDYRQLFQEIFMKLRSYFDLKIAGISLIDKKKEMLGSVIGRTDMLGGRSPEAAFWYNTFALNKIPFDLHLDSPRILTVDTRILFENRTKIKGFDDFLAGMSIQSLFLIPMQTGGQLLGFLIIPAFQTPTEKEDRDYLMKISNLVGSAIANAMAFTELGQREKISEMQLKLLADLVSIKDKDELFSRIASYINKLIPCEFVALNAEHKKINFLMSVSLAKDTDGVFKPLSGTRNAALALLSLKSKLGVDSTLQSMEVTGEKFEEMCRASSFFRQLKEKHAIKSIIVMQYVYPGVGELNLIIGRNKTFQWLEADSKVDYMMFSQNNEAYFNPHEMELGLSILPPIGLILSNIFAFEEIKALTIKLEQEKSFLLEEINLTSNFQEIIGNSRAIQQTQNKVTQVAPLDATVLIQGETGTGKELIARALHNLSKRKENVFITVNCAALPIQLIESELFGHEKGSYTGAVEKRIGKFEVANGGTIFLDEIGELPLEIQAKLLRVLQEKEFERLGGKSTIHSDVRIIAATNRDLEKEVSNGNFRADLFFRLNVFPITVPPLRERSEDIPLLVKYFLEKYSRKLGKKVSSIRKTDLDMLMEYTWPGNVRELEHLSERAVIISGGETLNFANLITPEVRKAPRDFESFKSLEDVEKEHIINALIAAGGKVTGEKSASQLLGINGKTLGSKMRKLKIKREISFTAEGK